MRTQTSTFSEADINSIEVKVHSDSILVEMEISAYRGSISQSQIDSVRDLLTKELQEPVALEVIIIPVNILQAPAQ